MSFITDFGIWLGKQGLPDDIQKEGVEWIKQSFRNGIEVGSKRGYANCMKEKKEQPAGKADSSKNYKKRK